MVRIFRGAGAALLSFMAFAATASAATVTTTIDDVNYSADDANVAAGATVVSYVGPAGPLVLPDSVTIAGTRYTVRLVATAAADSRGLTALTLPAGLQSIGVGAFAINALTSVVLPPAVTNVGAQAFRDNAIASVSFGPAVQTIGSNAFLNDALTSVVLPASLTGVAQRSFDGNPLTSAVFLGPAPTGIVPANLVTRTFPAATVLSYFKRFPDYTTPTYFGYPSQPRVTATFSANGFGTAPAAVDLNEGASVGDPGPLTDPAARFLGWFADAAGTTPVTFPATVSDDRTIYAAWSRLQAIQFVSTAPSPAYAGGTYTPVATGGGSGQAVAFGSSTPAVCTVDGTGVVTLLVAGVCTVTADQAAAPGYDSAPRATQTVTVVKAPSTTAVTLAPTSVVTGQQTVATATVARVAGAPTGTVQFAVDGTDRGMPVAVPSSGVVTLPDLVLPVGSRRVTATYVPSDAAAATGSSGAAELTVGQAATTTVLAFAGGRLSAKVAPVAPGAGSPSGTVTFRSGATRLGEATLTAGTATLAFSPTVDARITAEYAGDAGFRASQDAVAVAGPPPTQAQAVVLTCQGRAIRVLDVRPAGRSRVRVAGLALAKYAGRRVAIRVGRVVVGSATVAADGTFATSVPRRSGRYGAVIDGHVAPALQLHRILTVTAVRKTASGVRITGRLAGVAGGLRPLTISRQEGCTRSTVIGRGRTRKDGRFTVAVPAPSTGQPLAVLRVRTSRGGTTFTLPILVRR